ncbi:MAG: hypothetical protein IT203_07430 [Fimbriimonadaceae bacterium]|nr:hypothetical protein [Fimbriimonadaceae bacterium]
MAKRYLLIALLGAAVILQGCSSGPADDTSKDTGPAVPANQLGQAGGKGEGAGQKGDFKPLPVNPPTSG